MTNALPVAGELRARPRRSLPKWLVRGALVVVLVALLYFALSRAPVAEIVQALANLRPWQIALLIGVNALIYALISCRWWLVVHAENRRIRYLPMIPVRISVFGVSYFTLGPQVGGEPLQVFYLQKTYGLSFTRAAASVVMDKLFELLGNFVLVSFGFAAILHSGLLSTASLGSRIVLVLLGLVVSWPLVHIVLLYRRIYPLSAALHALGPQTGRRKAIRFARAAEHLAGQFCQRHPRSMIAGLFVSLLAACATVSEYVLITSFLHVHLPFWKLITAWTTGWLSFIVPWPGGLGVLEAGQVSVLGLFGISAAAALSVVLLMRGRDLLIGSLGLVLAGNSARRL